MTTPEEIIGLTTIHDKRQARDAYTDSVYTTVFTLDHSLSLSNLGHHL